MCTFSSQRKKNNHHKHIMLVQSSKWTEIIVLQENDEYLWTYLEMCRSYWAQVGVNFIFLVKKMKWNLWKLLWKI